MRKENVLFAILHLQSDLLTQFSNSVPLDDSAHVTNVCIVLKQQMLMMNQSQHQMEKMLN